MKNLFVFTIAIAMAVSAHAQTYTYSTLYSFKIGRTNPAHPLSLIIDSSGNLYGTALGGPHGYGTVFKVTPKGVETTLWDFTYQEVGGNEGGDPGPSLARDTAGNLYGELNYGSDKQDFGTVFELIAGKSGSYTYSDIAGDGTIGEVMFSSGGVFWMDCDDSQGPPCYTVNLMQTVNGQTTTLWNFSDPNDFSDPPAGGMLVRDGNVYGTASGDYGQTSYGYVFEWSPTVGLSVLHTFDGIDGSFPTVLRQDASGDLYGTTAGDGTDNNGTVFKITSTGAFSVLYTFPTGAEGPTGGLTLDSSNNLFGTTNDSVFKISSGGVESVIYSGAVGSVGSGLVMDKSGNLYSTTYSGGTNLIGSIFKLTKH